MVTSHRQKLQKAPRHDATNEDRCMTGVSLDLWPICLHLGPTMRSILVELPWGIDFQCIHQLTSELMRTIIRGWNPGRRVLAHRPGRIEAMHGFSFRDPQSLTLSTLLVLQGPSHFAPPRMRLGTQGKDASMSERRS